MSQIKAYSASASKARVPWILVGSPLLAISTYFLFIPPDQPDLIYFLLSIMGIYLAFTIIQIPFASWGAELSGDYNERSKITALREQFGADSGKSF